MRASLSFHPPRYKPLGGILLRPSAQRLKFTVYLWSHTLVCSRRNFERNHRKIFAAELPQVTICSISGILAAQYPIGCSTQGSIGVRSYIRACARYYISVIYVSEGISQMNLHIPSAPYIAAPCAAQVLILYISVAFEGVCLQIRFCFFYKVAELLHIAIHFVSKICGARRAKFSRNI